MSAYYDSMRRRARERSAVEQDGSTKDEVRTPASAVPPPPVAKPVLESAKAATAPPPPNPSRAPDQRGPMGDQFTALREQLMTLGQGDPLRAIVFVGCTGVEAVSGLVRAFARELALGGMRILVIDVVHPMAEDDGELDLGRAIHGGTALLAAPFGRGRLATLGSRTSSVDKENLFRSAAFEVWLANQRKEFDYVLFAAPPVLRYADAVLIGRQVDGSILVIEAQATERAALGRAREQLDRAGVRVIGAILDGVSTEGVPAPLRRYLGDDQG